MEGILFPLIMIAVCLVGGGIFMLIMKTSNNKEYTDEEELSLKTAQEFLNVKNLKGKFLYTNEGETMMYLRIQPISIDLYSAAEKRSLSKQLTVEMSDINHPFKFIALSRPVNIMPLIETMKATSRESNDVQRELLVKEMKYLNDMTQSEDIVERQFYISIWDKTDAFNEAELSKRASLFAEKFTTCGVRAEVIEEADIVRLLNYFYTPNATSDETEFTATIPFIDELLGNLE